MSTGDIMRCGFMLQNLFLMKNTKKDRFSLVTHSHIMEKLSTSKFLF